MKDEAKVIGRRWDHSANGYNDIIQREFTEAGEAWTQLLTEYAPATGKRALDVGCGPGFLALVLAMEGFDVTGIDCSGEMVIRARRNAEERGLSAEFRVMDSHELYYADGSFDYIVLRNATWLLYDPEKAFAEWFRVLRPGGRLLYLDANWSYLDDPELTGKLDEAYERFEKENGHSLNSYTGPKELSESADGLSAFRHILRPEWDIKTLPALGYSPVKVIPRVNERIYPPWKQKLYGAMDEFLITADKPV